MESETERAVTPCHLTRRKSYKTDCSCSISILTWVSNCFKITFLLVSLLILMLTGLLSFTACNYGENPLSFRPGFATTAWHRNIICMIITCRYRMLIFIPKMIAVDILHVVIVTVGRLDLLLSVIQSLSCSTLWTHHDNSWALSLAIPCWTTSREIPQLLSSTAWHNKTPFTFFHHQPNALSVRLLWACLWFWHDLFLLSTKFPR